MKTLESIKAVTIILVLSFIVGCNDQINSPVSQDLSSDAGKVNSEGRNRSDRFYGRISVKPHQSYTFNYDNTGFYWFHSISLLNCGDTKGRIEILGAADDYIVQLGCNTDGFNVQTITASNISGKIIHLDIFLTGSRNKPVVLNPNTAGIY